MIIVLIFAAFFIAAVIFAILDRVKYGEWDQSCCFALIFLALLLIAIGTTMIVMNGQYVREKVEYDYQQTLEELTATKNTIANIKDDYARSVATGEYNARVKEAKLIITKNHRALRNPWINWFVPRIYAELDAEAFEYISFSGG